MVTCPSFTTSALAMEISGLGAKPTHLPVSAEQVESLLDDSE
jgi:hypothetical protein